MLGTRALYALNARPRLRAIFVRLVLVFAVSLLAAGCGRRALDHAQPSADALAREVLNALASRNETRLRELALTEQEFEARVWPSLPAARSERNLPWSYVWMDLRQKSDATLRRTLSEHGGRRYQLQSVKFAGAPAAYGDYQVCRDAVLVVRDPSLEIAELRVFGSMIFADGGWKVFSYIADP